MLHLEFALAECWSTISKATMLVIPKINATAITANRDRTGLKIESVGFMATTISWFADVVPTSLSRISDRHEEGLKYAGLRYLRVDDLGPWLASARCGSGSPRLVEPPG